MESFLDLLLLSALRKHSQYQNASKKVGIGAYFLPVDEALSVSLSVIGTTQTILKVQKECQSSLDL
jgi:hypothetical protein